MKRLIIFILSAIAINANGQAVSADPSVGGLDITNLSDLSINANAISQNQVVKLKLPVYNFYQGSAIPAGTCKLQIGLGLRMTLDPDWSLATAPLNSYFTWTTTTAQSGQVLIIGNLVQELPADFDGEAVFRLKASVSGVSTISAQFLITNTNPSFTLSDINPLNNSASLTYGVVAPALPVTFKQVNVVKKDCSIRVAWSVGEEVNVKAYEVEVSKGSNDYLKVAEVEAKNMDSYSSQFILTPQLTSPTIYVRVRAVDLDGSYRYSRTVTAEGVCNADASSTLYARPNPAVYLNEIDIVNRSGMFNGAYTVSVMDHIGRVLNTKSISLVNAASFRVYIGNLPAGKYLVSVRGGSKMQTSVVEIEKL